MEQIKNIVHSVIADMSSNKKGSREAISEAWEDLLGKRTAKHTKIVSMEKGRMLVHVDSSVWLFQLTVKRNYLLRKLRKIAGDLEEISFRIGRL